jgi:ribonuclease G
MKELIIDEHGNDKKIMYVEDEKIIERYEENEQNHTIEGNIYIGKVQNVLSGLQAAFVDLGNGKNAFIHLKDILPKRDINDESNEKERIEEKYKIADYVRPGDPIIVEVKRDETSNKGARVSTHISLKGRFIVYMPNATFVTCSQKIKNEKKRQELIKLVRDNIPQGTGAIIRTVSENAKHEDIIADVKQLVDNWNNIRKMEVNNYPMEIFNSGGIIKKLVIDLVDADLDRIVVTTKETYDKVNEILKEIEKETKVELTKENVLEWYNLEKELKAADERKVWLKSGAFITIDKTEALTAIDVNSGKFVGKNDLEETIFDVNEEATYEIARQMRLRDIGGIVLIDFIDMFNDDHKKRIIELMKEAVSGDRSRVQIEEFTKLNLLEITRKHICSNYK